MTTGTEYALCPRLLEALADVSVEPDRARADVSGRLVEAGHPSELRGSLSTALYNALHSSGPAGGDERPYLLRAPELDRRFAEALPHRTTKENHFSFSFPSDEGKAFTLMSVRQAPAEGRQISNMYSEIVGDDGSTRRILSAETVSYLDPPVVAEQLHSAGFRVEEEKGIKLPTGSDDSSFRFVMMRCTVV